MLNASRNAPAVNPPSPSGARFERQRGHLLDIGIPAGLLPTARELVRDDRT